MYLYDSNLWLFHVICPWNTQFKCKSNIFKQCIWQIILYHCLWFTYVILWAHHLCSCQYLGGELYFGFSDFSLSHLFACYWKLFIFLLFILLTSHLLVACFTDSKFHLSYSIGCFKIQTNILFLQCFHTLMQCFNRILTQMNVICC